MARATLPIGRAWPGGASPAASIGNQQGFSVAISGSFAVVGAPGVTGSVGAASIWEHEGGEYVELAELKDPRDTKDDFYGWSVAIYSTTSSTYVAVGGKPSNGEPDRVYIYKSSGTKWPLQATLPDPSSYSTDEYGATMALSSSVFVVGAPGVNNNAGSIYIYQRSGTKWNLEDAKTDPGDAANDFFGQSVSTSGNDVLASGVDIAYIFTNSGGDQWTQTAVLKNPGSPEDNFGYSASLESNTAVLGAPGGVPGTGIGSPLSAGAAYIFTKKGSSWSQAEKVTAPSGTKGDEFGYSVSQAGDNLSIGMPLYGSVSCGTVFTFSLVGGTWTLQEQLQDPGCIKNDEFGFSTALLGTTDVIGAPGTDNDAGAVHFLSLVPTAPENILQDPDGTGVAAVTFSLDSTILATGDLNGSAYLWGDGKTGAYETLPSPNGQGVYGAAFSPDGSTLAVGTVNTQANAGSIYLWNVASGTVTTTLQDPDSRGVDSVAYSLNDVTLAAADANGNTYLWDASSGTLLKTLPDPSSEGVKSVAFTPDGDFLFAADGNGNTYIWNLSTYVVASTLADPSSQGVNGVAIAANQDSATADGNGHVYLWEPPGTLTRTLSAPDDQAVTSVVFSPDSTSVAAATHSSIYVWDVATGNLIATFTDPGSQGATQLAWSPSGNTLAVGDANGETYVWGMGWLDS